MKSRESLSKLFGALHLSLRFFGPEMCHVTLMICPEQVMKATKAHSCDGEEDVSCKGAQIPRVFFSGESSSERERRREREFTGQVMKARAPSFLICGSC